MSLLPFLRNFIGVEGDNAAAGVVKALVQLDPDSATVADLRTMEQDLDSAGRMIENCALTWRTSRQNSTRSSVNITS
jgi:hypothetical protein